MTFEVGLPPRYRAVRPLGQGGFGDVMLVRDVDRAEDIAMKRLARMDPASIRRFKNEFRVLQGLRHPSLARLHELFAVDDAWFLAMEYIAGEDFSAHVRPGGDARTAQTLPEHPIADTPSGHSQNCDEPRLRAALARLADGVFALHRAGIIHRDIKPPNVLVDHHGRVVILDFGLAAQVEGEVHHSADARLIGTPGYMAPEQAQAQPLTRAVDWYAVGVMLFEALTGRRPFVGSLRDIVESQLAGAPDPARFGIALPADLHYLCMRLLAPRAEDRPEGAEIIGLLGKPEPIVVAASAGLDFVGRSAELETIAVGLDALARSGPCVIEVVADSGLGKSALVRRATEHARMSRNAAILAARCYEREAMPYKGVDPLMDELAEVLRRRSNEDVLAVMPRDARALCRLFPVLASVDELARAPEIEAVENRDTLRSRAIAALRELLARLADRQPLVVVLDDMQWCCSDSARVLVDLLAGSAPPRALFLFAYRPQARHANPALRVLHEGLAAAGIPRSELVLAPLSEDEALQMARTHAPAGTDDVTLRAVVADAQGSPMLIEELLLSERGPHGLGLDQMIASRIAALDPAARTALGYIAAAGRLIEMPTLREACGLEAAELAEAIGDLEEAGVVQRAPSGDDVAVETKHDRVREVACSSLPADQLARCHGALGEALAARDADPEAIAEHFRLAGSRDRARPFVLQAATKAVEALAHDRAIALYRLALELSGDEDRFPIEVALGDTLTFDGQGVAAAAAYRQALAHAPTPTDAIDLKRRIAEQLLRSGRIDDGLDAIDDVMQAANLAIPKSATQALTSLLYQRFRLWTRGVEVPKQRRPLSRETQVALDACWSAGVALSGFDLVKSADMKARQLRYALEAGDPMRISLGLAMEGVMLALDSAKSQQRAAQVIEKAEQLAQEIGDPYAMGWASGAASVLAFAEGNWRAAVSLGDYAVALFQVRCVDAAWEVGTVQSWFRLRAQFALGELAAARTDAAEVERDAVRRQDLYTQTNLRLGVRPYLELAANEPASARQLVADTIAVWSKRGWHNQHQDALRADCMIDIYEGDAARMLARLDGHARHLGGARQAGRLMLHASRAAALLVQARGEPSRKPAALAIAKQLARKVTAEGNPWAKAVAAGLDGRIAALEGGDGAPARIEAAARALGDADMPLHAAALRRLRGVLVGGDAGAAAVASADTTLSSHGIADPARMVEILIC